MAAFQGTVSFSDVALSAATTKTVLQLVAAANHRVKILNFGIAFDGVSGTNEPVDVWLARQTTAGTASAATVYKKDDSLAETLQTTAQHTATVEPTTTDIVWRMKVHPQSGLVNPIPFGQEIIIGGGDRMGLLMNAANAVNVSGFLDFEE